MATNEILPSNHPAEHLKPDVVTCSIVKAIQESMSGNTDNLTSNDAFQKELNKESSSIQ